MHSLRASLLLTTITDNIADSSNKLSTLLRSKLNTFAVEQSPALSLRAVASETETISPTIDSNCSINSAVQYSSVANAVENLSTTGTYNVLNSAVQCSNNLCSDVTDLSKLDSVAPTNSAVQYSFVTHDVEKHSTTGTRNVPNSAVQCSNTLRSDVTSMPTLDSLLPNNSAVQGSLVTEAVNKHSKIGTCNVPNSIKQHSTAQPSCLVYRHQIASLQIPLRSNLWSVCYSG